MLENEKRSNSTTLPQKLTKHWAAPSNCQHYFWVLKGWVRIEYQDAKGLGHAKRTELILSARKRMNQHIQNM